MNVFPCRLGDRPRLLCPVGIVDRRTLFGITPPLFYPQRRYRRATFNDNFLNIIQEEVVSPNTIIADLQF